MSAAGPASTASQCCKKILACGPSSGTAPKCCALPASWPAQYGVADRSEFQPGDMFNDAPPADCDVVLLSNILHDWDTRECEALVKHCASALPSGGGLLIHDAFLSDNLDGPLPVALYSAALFCVTEGPRLQRG